ncbi:hypothetical protein KKA15_04815 [Patescibacteria group bacterium]|nr:hypothetical protein [Patescibacteria group bacterium]
MIKTSASLVAVAFILLLGWKAFWFTNSHTSGVVDRITPDFVKEVVAGEKDQSQEGEKPSESQPADEYERLLIALTKSEKNGAALARKWATLSSWKEAEVVIPEHEKARGIIATAVVHFNEKSDEVYKDILYPEGLTPGNVIEICDAQVLKYLDLPNYVPFRRLMPDAYGVGFQYDYGIVLRKHMQLLDKREEIKLAANTPRLERNVPRILEDEITVYGSWVPSDIIVEVGETYEFGYFDTKDEIAKLRIRSGEGQPVKPHWVQLWSNNKYCARVRFRGSNPLKHQLLVKYFGEPKQLQIKRIAVD